MGMRTVIFWTLCISGYLGVFWILPFFLTKSWIETVTVSLICQVIVVMCFIFSIALVWSMSR